jgi:UDP-N-acetylmuramate: L-alanyl-gamma-D-glutamyl-meso-diaminopimelate ligase
MNLEAARIACNGIGISDDIFYTAIQSFKGAAKRLELVYKAPGFNFYKDFAHSPSKLRATTDAVKQQFPNRKVIACMELHTFSSLTEEFLLQYSGSMNLADEAIVYFNPQTIEHKKLKPITTDQVIKCFNRADLMVFTSSSELKDYLKQKNHQNSVLLMMSSGNFDGLDFSSLAKELLL